MWNGLLNTVKSLDSISGNPPPTDGAINNASHTTGIIPITERMMADCLSSCFTAFILIPFDYFELLLWGVSDLYDQFVNGIGCLALTHKVFTLLIKRVNQDAVFIFRPKQQSVVVLSLLFTSVYRACSFERSCFCR